MAHNGSGSTDQRETFHLPLEQASDPRSRFELVVLVWTVCAGATTSSRQISSPISLGVRCAINLGIGVGHGHCGYLICDHRASAASYARKLSTAKWYPPATFDSATYLRGRILTRGNAGVRSTERGLASAPYGSGERHDGFRVFGQGATCTPPERTEVPLRRARTHPATSEYAAGSDGVQDQDRGLARGQSRAVAVV
jgi:hypothetical protein